MNYLQNILHWKRKIIFFCILLLFKKKCFFVKSNQWWIQDFPDGGGQSMTLGQTTHHLIFAENCKIDVQIGIILRFLVTLPLR